MFEDNIIREFDPKTTWNSRTDQIVEKFYKPALKNSILYQRMSGYFSSTSFSHVAKEIIEFIERNGRIQLVTSPNLSNIDKDIIERSIEDPEKLLSDKRFVANTIPWSTCSITSPSSNVPVCSPHVSPPTID